MPFSFCKGCPSGRRPYDTHDQAVVAHFVDHALNQAVFDRRRCAGRHLGHDRRHRAARLKCEFRVLRGFAEGKKDTVAGGHGLTVRRCYDVAGADFGPGQIHEHEAGARVRMGRRAHIGGHGRPRLGVVVRAIDTGAVHSGEHEVFDMRRILGGPLGQRDQNAGLATGRPGTEHRLGMTVQHVLAKPKVLTPRPHRFTVRAADHLQIGDDRVQGRHHAGLATGQRGHAPGRQRRLHRPEVDAAQGHVMRQILGARAKIVAPKHRLPPAHQLSGFCDHGVANARQFVQQLFGIVGQHVLPPVRTCRRNVEAVMTWV